VNRQDAKDAKFETGERDALEPGKFPENLAKLATWRFNRISSVLWSAPAEGVFDRRRSFSVGGLLGACWIGMGRILRGGLGGDLWIRAAPG
jgi:hypothetical protein